MKTDNRHKESTKAMQEFINALRECIGKEPLYVFTYEKDQRAPRNLSKIVKE